MYNHPEVLGGANGPVSSIFGTTREYDPLLLNTLCIAIVVASVEASNLLLVRSAYQSLSRTENILENVTVHSIEEDRSEKSNKGGHYDQSLRRLVIICFENVTVRINAF